MGYDNFSLNLKFNSSFLWILKDQTVIDILVKENCRFHCTFSSDSKDYSIDCLCRRNAICLFAGLRRLSYKIFIFHGKSIQLSDFHEVKKVIDLCVSRFNFNRGLEFMLINIWSIRPFHKLNL